MDVCLSVWAGLASAADLMCVVVSLSPTFPSVAGGRWMGCRLVSPWNELIPS